MLKPLENGQLDQITIKGRMPGLNDYISKERSNRFMMLKQIDRYRGIQELKKLGFKTRYSLSGNFYSYLFSDLKKWFNSEYVEPHKWEQWELEALSHINKNLTTITKDSNACQFMNFPSMKEKEIINIDEELERNGMHR